MEKKINSITHHFRFLLGHKLLLATVILTGLGSSLLEALGISFIFPLLEGEQSTTKIPFPFDQLNFLFVDYNAGERLQIVAVLLVIIIFSKSILVYANIVANSHIQVISDKHFKMICCEQLLRVGMGYLNSEKIGKLHTVCVSYTQNLGIFAIQIGSLIPQFFNIVIFLIMVMFLSWEMTLISIFLSILASLALQRTMRKASVTGRTRSQEIANINSILFEILSAMKIIRTFNREKKTITLYENYVNRFKNAILKASIVDGSVRPIFECTGILTLSTIMIIGTIFLFDPNKGPGLTGVLAFIVIFQRISSSAMSLNNVRAKIKADRPAFEEVFRFLEMADKQNLENGIRHFHGMKEGLEFKNIEFSFHKNDKKVLDNISFFVPKGTKLGVVGTSGAGKSTLADLFLRFYDPLKGQILLDGIDLKQFDIGSLRKQIGVVSQDIFLFNDSVQNNISYAKPDATHDEIEAAAIKAHAHEFIQELPQDYDTLVGDRGVLLSAGEKQRISIARAIIIDPEILIFDEATSALDSESEKIVQQTLDEIGEGRTVITIAHRLSTIYDSDKIIVMESGRIVEEGTHQELIHQGGTYKNLVQIQEFSKTGHQKIKNSSKPRL